VKCRASSAVIGILVGALGLSIDPTAHAQYTTNFQDTIISGVTSNWSGSYIVGSNTFADILFVQNGGVLADGNGYLGYEASGSNNVAAIIGSGSVWSNAGSLYVGNSGASNFLWITAGAAVVDDIGFLGYSFCSDNEVLVSGQGSVWSNSGAVYVGYYFGRGNDNSLTISEGGMVYSSGGAMLGGDGNAVVVTGSGSVWNNTGDIEVGSADGGGNDSLTIADGGAMYDGGGGISVSCTVLVTGTGSVWSNSGTLYSEGTLTIADGGAVYSSSGQLGDDLPATVVVVGPGSVWRNTGTLAIGSFGSVTSLTITNGGAVYSGNTSFDGLAAAQALVTEAGSIWNIGGGLVWGGPGVVNIFNDGVVVADSVEGDSIGMDVSGGGLYVTNGPGTIVLNGYYGGAIALNGGTVTANQLVVGTNSQSGNVSSFGFASGLLTSGGTFVTNGNEFVVGDGTDAATFHLAGGFHSFADGLMVSNNAFVTGCGTIDGSVIVDPGGTVAANCGGSLTFTGIVINNGTLRASNGSVLEFYGPVVNNGLIDLSGGMAIFHSVFINNGSIIEPAPAFQITGIVQQATNILITWQTTPGETNELQVTPGGPGGTYSTNNFTPIFTVTNTIGTVTNYLDIGGATNSSRYYRVRLVP